MIFKLIQRSFFDIFNALKTAYPHLTDWLWTQLAGFFENTSELVNNIAYDIFNPQTRDSAYAFAANNDYEPIESSGASAAITITLNSAIVKTLVAGYQIAGISAITNELIIYELDANASSGGTDTINGTFSQKKSETSVTIGTVTSNDDWFEIPIDGHIGILKTSISLTIAAAAWTRVDNFDSSISTDKHFVILYQSGGAARVQFGNGTTGEKPTLNETVFADFAKTRGAIGRLDANTIIINVGADVDINSLTNAAAATGGNDAEGVQSIIRNARANVRLRDAVWYQQDVEDAARLADASVIKAYNTPDVGVINVQIVPDGSTNPPGGGNPSAGLKTTVETFVKALSQFGVVPTNAFDPNYVDVTITATVTARTGFTLATVQDLVKFSLLLVSSPFDNEILEYYDANGIGDTRTVKINSIYSFTFVEADEEALEFIINQWKTILGDKDAREFGQTLEVGNLWQMGDSLFDYGVDVFTLTAPLTNTTAAANEIINGNSVTVT